MDWVLEKISGSGRVSGTRWALLVRGVFPHYLSDSFLSLCFFNPDLILVYLSILILAFRWIQIFVLRWIQILVFRWIQFIDTTSSFVV